MFSNSEQGVNFEIIVEEYFTLFFYLSFICIPALFISLIKTQKLSVKSSQSNLNINIKEDFDKQSQDEIFENKEKFQNNETLSEISYHIFENSENSIIQQNEKKENFKDNDDYRRHKKNNGCCDKIKDLLQNPNFLYLILSFTSVYGFFSAYTGKINSIFETYAINSIENIEIWATSAGIMTSIVIACLINRKKKIKCLMITLIIISLLYYVTMIALIITIDRNKIEINPLGYVCLYIIYNMSLSPIYSICNYLVYEMTYPTHSSVSLGLMISLSMMSKLLISAVLDAFLNAIFVNVLGIMLVIMALVMLMVMKGKML